MVLKRIIFAVGAIAVVAFYAALAFLIPLRTGAGEPARAGRVDADTFLALAADAIDLCTVAGVESFLDEAAFDHEFTQSVVVDTSGGPVTNPVSRFRQAAQAEELWYWLNRAVARCTPTSTPDEFGLSVPQASADWVRLPPEELDASIAIGTRTVQTQALLADIIPGAMTAYYRDTPTGEIQRVDWLPVSDDGTWALATLSSIGSTNRHNVVASRYARGGWVSGYGVVGNARIRATGAPGVARPSIQLTYFPAVSFATSAACRVSNGGSGEVALLAPDAIGPATTEVVTATHEFSSFPAWIESFSPTLPTGQVYQIEYTNARVYRDITRHLPGGIRPFTWADFTTISDAIDAFPLNIVQDHVLFEATNAVRRGYAEFDGRWTTDQVFAFDGLSLVDLPESEVGAAGESAVAFGPAGYPYAEGFVRLSSPLVEVSTNKEGEVSFSTNYAVLTHKTLSVSIHAPASLVWCIDPGDVMRITNVWTNAALTLRGRWAVYAPCEAGGSDISAFAAPPLQQGAFEVAGTNVSAGADFSSWGEILLGELETSPTNWIAEQWRVDGGTTNVTSWVQHVRAHRLLRGRGVLHVERANPPGGGRGLSADRSRTPREEELRSRGIVR